MSIYIGRVVGNSVMKMHFRKYFGEKLQVGEMLVVENRTSTYHFLIRVMDIEHGANEKDCLTTEAGHILKMGASNDEFDVSRIRGQLFCAGANIGSERQALFAGYPEEVLSVDLGPPLHCMIMPGKLHFMEAQALVALAAAPESILKEQR